VSATTASLISMTRSPWRSDRVTRAIFVIALLGTLEAGYLTYAHYNLGALACVGAHHGVSTCEQVQSSVYSRLAGIPVAILGLIGYVSILGSLFVRGELGRAAGFCVALIGCGFSLYLTYRELFTLKEICEWCVGSATLMTLLAILAAVRFLRAEQPA
jgi:uncharacterized membrane protein